MHSTNTRERPYSPNNPFGGQQVAERSFQQPLSNVFLQSGALEYGLEEQETQSSTDHRKRRISEPDKQAL